MRLTTMKAPSASWHCFVMQPLANTTHATMPVVSWSQHTVAFVGCWRCGCFSHSAVEGPLQLSCRLLFALGCEAVCVTDAWLCGGCHPPCAYEHFSLLFCASHVSWLPNTGQQTHYVCLFFEILACQGIRFRLVLTFQLRECYASWHCDVVARPCRVFHLLMRWPALQPVGQRVSVSHYFTSDVQLVTALAVYSTWSKGQYTVHSTLCTHLMVTHPRDKT